MRIETSDFAENIMLSQLNVKKIFKKDLRLGVQDRGDGSHKIGLVLKISADLS